MAVERTNRGASFLGEYKYLEAIARKNDSYPGKPRAEHTDILDWFFSLGDLDGVRSTHDSDPGKGKVSFDLDDVVGRRYKVTADLSGPGAVLEKKWDDYYDLLGIRTHYTRKFTDGPDSLRVEETTTTQRDNLVCGLHGADIAGILMHNPDVKIAGLLYSPPPETKTTVLLINKENGTVTEIE